MITFFILSSVALVSSFLLITNKNPLYSVLNLVVLFVCGALLLVLIGLDFIPFVFIVVYVGAVAVLFLFVVIILDIKLSKTGYNKKNLSLFFIFNFMYFIFLIYNNNNSIIYNYYKTYPNDLYESCFYYDVDKAHSLKDFGYVLYTYYMEYVIICGFVLLLAIVGAIVLTSRRRNLSLKQKIFKQAERFYSVGKTKFPN